MAKPATMVSDTFSEIFSELNNNVTQITDSQNNTVSLRDNNGNYWYGAYPDTSLITDKDEYPIGILRTPTFTEDQIGLHSNEVALTAQIIVYGTRAEHPPKFIEKAVDHLRNNADKLDRLYNFEVGTTTQDFRVAGNDMKVHQYSAPLTLNMLVDP